MSQNNDAERVFHFARYRGGKAVKPELRIRTTGVMDAYRRARLADADGNRDQLILHRVTRPQGDA